MKRRNTSSIREDTLFSFEGKRKRSKPDRSGGDSKEDPPVPMPNTEVKLLNVDDTWRETAWESRKLPEQNRKILRGIHPFGFLLYILDKNIPL